MDWYVKETLEDGTTSFFGPFESLSKAALFVDASTFLGSDGILQSVKIFRKG